MLNEQQVCFRCGVSYTYVVMKNAISELMSSNYELHQELSSLQANCNLLQLNNEELSFEAKKSQLNITISNASCV